ncbi:MAG TPA: hypothetical protein DCZ91_18645 [Lachnospiraceae bacterium]|nr:hypothetical protein [Lachnospiraceae bacterium]
MALNSYAAWPCWMITWIPLELTLKITFAQKGGYEDRMISRYDRFTGILCTTAGCTGGCGTGNFYDIAFNVLITAACFYYTVLIYS